MEAAIAEAEKASFSDEKYRVGCVVVVDNEIVGTGHTGEFGPFCGAIEAALRKVPVKPPKFFFFYNYYVTLDPSGKRLDNRVPEAELLVNAGVKRLFLGTCEERLYRKERGYRTLSRNDVVTMVDYAEPLRKASPSSVLKRFTSDPWEKTFATDASGFVICTAKEYPYYRVATMNINKLCLGF